MTTISWLHLTDLHFGMKGQKWLWPTLKREFLSDVDQVRKKVGGRFDLVLFTGDLTQTGTSAEFEKLDEALNDIWTHLNAEAQLVAIPGNHDLVRPSSRLPIIKAMQQWWNDPDIPNDFWTTRDNQYRKLVDETFSPFLSWRTQSRHHLSVDGTKAEVPGDLACTFQKEDVRLGVVGLNSAMLQLTDADYEGKLSVEPRQLHAVCGDDAPVWLARHDASILLTHHPPDWLSPRSRDTFASEILGRDNFLFHLYGHKHVPASDSQRESGGPTRRRLQGASLFGLENFGSAQEVRRLHGYSAGLFDFGANNIRIRIWPRLAQLVNGGYYRLGQDRSFDLDEDGAYSESVLRALASGHGGAGHKPPHSRRSASAPTQGPQRFLDSYRQRFSASFERWDLQSVGVAQPGGGAKPVAAQLDDMYVPLRLREEAGAVLQAGSRPSKPFNATDVLSLSDSVVVRGPAGAGKTTWIRMMFRELLRRPDALPLLIVLRDLAGRWSQKGCTGEARSIDAFLQSTICEHVSETTGNLLRNLLLNESLPRPILLVDGWDEVGPLAEELRTKLSGFLREYPRVIAVVTSRPYGEGQPSGSDKFRVLDIAPLSNDEIKSLATRFFKYCYGDDPEPVSERVDRFFRAVQRAQEPLRLARTPLLLTMMLFISRTGPLPDKRHRLYQACIDNLLTALPSQKEEEGALRPRRHWSPSDVEDRLRIVAMLAHSLQVDARRAFPDGSSIIASMQELLATIPDHWPTERESGMSHLAQREGFIYWLAGPAGVLTELADGSFSFSHLSFQEYLCAWHLNATVEGDLRDSQFCKHASDTRWFEVLRLWGAIIGAQSEERLSSVISALLRQGDDGLCLAGMLFADGLLLVSGSDTFADWCSRFVQAVATPLPPEHAGHVAAAWNASQQDARKSKLQDGLAATAKSANIGRWLSMSSAVRALGPLAEPNDKSAAKLFSLSQPGLLEDAQDLAIARVLSVVCATWPKSGELALLQAWPSPRRVAGVQFQIAALCGATKADMLEVATLFFRGNDWSSKHLKSVTASFAELAGHFASDERPVASGLALGLGEGVPSALEGLTRGPAFWPYASVIVSATPSYIQVGVTKRGVDTLTMIPGLKEEALCLGIRDYRCPRVAIPRRSKKFPSTISGAQWIRDAAGLLAGCATMYAARYELARNDGEQTPAERLISAACRVSLRPTDKALMAEFLATDRDLAGQARPLWHGLARVIAGTNSLGDVEMLEDAVARPESFPAPLSWGLQYLVRGDVFIGDDLELTLDEIAASSGMQRFSIVDPAPPPGEARRASRRGPRPRERNQLAAEPIVRTKP